jgi:ribosomal protein S18 acetylase RimI-like enzyme
MSNMKQAASGESSLFEIRPAAPSDQNELVEVLACAFEEDPLTTWFVRHDIKRPSGLRQLFRWYLRETLPQGFSHACMNPPAAAALWMGPDQWKVSFLRQVLLLPEIVGVVGMDAVVSRLRGIDILQRCHPHASHYYLAVLGTHPNYQGRGVGSRVLAAGLRRCDDMHLPAYLETANPRNLPFYERNGFYVSGQVEIPYGGPLVWRMWREPQAA